jgi:hypothetical protein
VQGIAGGVNHGGISSLPPRRRRVQLIAAALEAVEQRQRPPASFGQNLVLISGEDLWSSVVL